MLDAVLMETDSVRIMRDPTRGGLATTLVEIAEDFTLTMQIQELLSRLRKKYMVFVIF